MAYAVIKNFSVGLDRRGSQLSGPPGSLWTLINGHLNRAGEIERRKKFVSTYTLPAGTFGLHSVGGVMYVFGSGADPGVPSGVTYQRLQHPDASTAMTAVLATESFDSKPYVVAQYADGDVYHFYDGTVIAGWLNGVVRDDMTDNDGIATHLKTLVDADSEYSASVSTNVITITGPVGEAFTVTTEADNVDGGTDDQTAAVATTQVAVAGVSEVLATCSFDIVGGSASAGNNKISAVAVNGVALLTSAVDWATSDAITAAAVAQEINDTTSSPNYTATSDGSTVTISAAAGTGDGPNTFALAVTVAGNVIVDNASFEITGGSSNPGTNKVTSITINGIEILNTAVDWATSNTATASAVASQINSYNSTPEYIAFAEGQTVRIGKTVSTSTDGTLSMVVTVGGDVTTGSKVDWSPTATSMAGGVDSSAGQAQISTVTIGGTFEAGDRFSILLAKGGETKRFGATGNPEKVGITARTFKDKIYSTIDSLLFFTGVGDVTHVNRDDDTVPGANFINMAAQDEGSQTLTAVGVYQGNLAIFARNVTQVWSIDADPDLNVFLQLVRNTGTRSPGSVVEYGNNDLFYLSDSGIRSLKARDSSNAAFVSDVGTPIDPLVIDHIATLSDATVEAAAATLEPREDRYWLALGTRVYVFSFYPGSEISAWSYYDVTDDVGAAITQFARLSDKIYARSGNTIYLYGGAAGTTYPDADEVLCTIEFPFLDGETPATKKELTGFDVGCEGVWLVEIYVDPQNGAEAASPIKLTAGTVSGTTYYLDEAGLGAEATHFAPRLVCSAAGAAKVVNFAVHWKDPHDDD